MKSLQLSMCGYGVCVKSVKDNDYTKYRKCVLSGEWWGVQLEEQIVAEIVLMVMAKGMQLSGNLWLAQRRAQLSNDGAVDDRSAIHRHITFRINGRTKNDLSALKGVDVQIQFPSLLLIRWCQLQLNVNFLPLSFSHIFSRLKIVGRYCERICLKEYQRLIKGEIATVAAVVACELLCFVCVWCWCWGVFCVLFGETQRVF